MKHVKIFAVIALVVALVWYYRNNIESFRPRWGRPRKPRPPKRGKPPIIKKFKRSFLPRMPRFRPKKFSWR